MFAKTLSSAVLLLFSALGAAATPLDLKSLLGSPVTAVRATTPTILAFWRADCGPCLAELRNAKAYAAAAEPARFLFVGLQTAAALKPAATRAGVPMDLVVQAIGPAKDILTTYGGPPPRLPLAVALDRQGHVRGRHTGLLGTEQVHAWALALGGAGARG